jgi:cytochrome c553
MSGGAAIVSLDQLSAQEIATSLNRYRGDETGTTVMHRLARGYSMDEVAAVSAHLGRKEPR